VFTCPFGREGQREGEGVAINLSQVDFAFCVTITHGGKPYLFRIEVLKVFDFNKFNSMNNSYYFTSAYSNYTFLNKMLITTNVAFSFSLD
jgi:hypothetical protein